MNEELDAEFLEICRNGKMFEMFVKMILSYTENLYTNMNALSTIFFYLFIAKYKLCEDILAGVIKYFYLIEEIKTPGTILKILK